MSLPVMAWSLAACGTITFGDDRSPDSGPIAIEDVGDAGPADTGIDGGPDLGPIDLGCVPDPEPSVPAAWPFESTPAKYQEIFFAPMERASPGVMEDCASNNCHGVRPIGIGPGEQGIRHPPFIPTVEEITMYGQPMVDIAVQQLWLVITDRSGEDPTLVTSHDPARGGAEALNNYRWGAGEMEKLAELVALSLSCRWNPVYSSRDGGVQCLGGDPADAGPADTGGPIDAGPLDGGPVDGGAPPDTGVPADTGVATDGGPPADAAPDSGAPPDTGAPADAGEAVEQCSCPFTQSQVPSDLCVNL